MFEKIGEIGEKIVGEDFCTKDANFRPMSSALVPNSKDATGLFAEHCWCFNGLRGSDHIDYALPGGLAPEGLEPTLVTVSVKSTNKKKLELGSTHNSL